MKRLLCLAALLQACAPTTEPTSLPVQEETPEAEILRVGSIWEARQGGKSFRSAPDPVAVAELETISVLALERGAKQAKEEIELTERFQMRAGGEFICRARGGARVGVRYGRKSGQPALEVTRPPVRVTRECNPPDFPDPEVELASGTARFILRGDRLTAFAPPLEKRVYLPID